MRSPKDVEFMKQDIHRDEYLSKRKDNIKKCFECKEGNGTFLKWLSGDNKKTSLELDEIKSNT